MSKGAPAKQKKLSQSGCNWLLMKSINYQCSRTERAMATHPATTAQQATKAHPCISVCAHSVRDASGWVLEGANKKPCCKETWSKREKQTRKDYRKMYIHIQVVPFFFLFCGAKAFFPSRYSCFVVDQNDLEAQYKCSILDIAILQDRVGEQSS